MMKATIVLCGGTGLEVKKPLVDLLIDEFGRLPKCIDFVGIDSDPDTKPDVLLNRHMARDILRNPENYGINIPPNISPEKLEKADKGNLLDRGIGRISYLSSIADIESALRASNIRVEEGAKEERKRGLEVPDHYVVVLIGSPMTGTGGVLLVELPSFVKYIFGCKVYVVTSFAFTPSGSGLSIYYSTTLRGNAEEVKKEYESLDSAEIAESFFTLEKGENKTLCYPLINNLKIPAELPDYVFNVLTQSKSMKSLIEGMAVFVKDLVVHGVPINLKGIENTLIEAEGRVINVHLINYTFPFEDVRRYYEREGLRRQLEVSIKTGVSSGVLLEAKLRKFLASEISSMNVEKVLEEMKRGIRTGTLNINSVVERISGYVESHAEELRRAGAEIIEGVKEELERKIRKGHLDEALDSIEKTLGFISSIKIIEPKDVDLRELENRYAEYKRTLNKAFNWIGTVDRRFSAVMAKLKEYAEFRLDRAEYSAKLEFREELGGYLERKRNEILDFKIDIERIKPLELPRDVNIVNRGVDDLIIPFEFEELSLENVEKQWIAANEEKIVEKTKNSLEPKLNVSMLQGTDEGWRSAR
ncbi:hypothetical protein DRP04_13590, partial [Archaeoglobales archaeon]